MNLSKLAHSYNLSLAENQALKSRNQANLTRIASTLQQRSNAQILQSLGEYLDA